jgi:hypothetical protein
VKAAAVGLLVFSGAWLAWSPARADTQDVRARFVIVDATDTTVSLVLGSASWLKPGMSGIIVDPRSRDDLVARFVIVALE